MNNRKLEINSKYPVYYFHPIPDLSKCVIKSPNAKRS